MDLLSITKDFICFENDNLYAVRKDQIDKQTIYLDCHDNKLNSLPELPENLVILYCYYNMLKYLPDLPDHLVYLYCYHNKNRNFTRLT